MDDFTNRVSHKAIKDDIDQLRGDLKELEKNQKDILKELSRYKGFIGGVLFTFSALGAAIGMWFKYKG